MRHSVLLAVLLLFSCAVYAAPADDAIIHATIVLPDNTSISLSVLERSSITLKQNGDDPQQITFTPERVTILSGADKPKEVIVVQWTIVRGADGTTHIARIGEQLQLPILGTLFKLQVRFLEPTDGRAYTRTEETHEFNSWTATWQHVNH